MAVVEQSGTSTAIGDGDENTRQEQSGDKINRAQGHMTMVRRLSLHANPDMLLAAAAAAAAAATATAATGSIAGTGMLRTTSVGAGTRGSNRQDQKSNLPRLKRLQQVVQRFDAAVREDDAAEDESYSSPRRRRNRTPSSSTAWGSHMDSCGDYVSWLVEREEREESPTQSRGFEQFYSQNRGRQHLQGEATSKVATSKEESDEQEPQQRTGFSAFATTSEVMNIANLFWMYDVDESGTIDAGELLEMLSTGADKMRTSGLIEGAAFDALQHGTVSRACDDALEVLHIRPVIANCSG
jgi:hypothetical protein